MSERLSIERSELDSPSEVFKSLTDLREEAQGYRVAYQEHLTGMNELCRELVGTELLITGRLHGRSGTTVYPGDPRSQVERLHVRIGSARVNAYEGYGELISRHLPFIDITANTIETNELVCAHLGIDEFGVSFEILEPSTSRV